MKSRAAKEMLPISALEFGFYHIDGAAIRKVAKALVDKLDLLKSEGVTWEACESDGSPAIRFVLGENPWLLESEAFKPVIDAMYKDCLEMIQNIAENQGIDATFRWVGVNFVEQPSTVNVLKKIFDLDRR